MTTFTKSLCVFIFVTLAGLFVGTTFIPYPAAREEARAYFSDSEIDMGWQYVHERRLLFWAGTTLEMAILCTFALTGIGRRWADRLIRLAGNNRVLAALGLIFTILLISEAVDFPLGLWRLERAHAWGMSNLTRAAWLQEKGITLGIKLITEAIVIVGLYLLLIWFPRTWWLFAALGGTLLATIFVYLMPLVISPLYNDFTPLAETEWRDQQPRVQALIDKAGVPVQEILVMNASRQSNHTNAYFTGFGSSRRIVLYDTLLKKHTPDEIESVLAHEFGHWQHDHIVKGLALGTIAALLGLFLLDRLLAFACGRAPWQLQSKADPAGLPLILLAMSLGAWAALPVQNVVSRHFERQADQVALDLAKQPKAFIDCEIKMARDNLGNVAPTPWNVWLFASHPPVVERIRMAEEWRESSTKGTKDRKKGKE